MTFLKFRTSRGQSTWVFECAVGRPYAIKKSPSDAYDTERWVRAAAGPTYATHVDSVVPKTTLLLVPIPGRVAELLHLRRLQLVALALLEVSAVEDRRTGRAAGGAQQLTVMS